MFGSKDGGNAYVTHLGWEDVKLPWISLHEADHPKMFRPRYHQHQLLQWCGCWPPKYISGVWSSDRMRSRISQDTCELMHQSLLWSGWNSMMRKGPELYKHLHEYGECRWWMEGMEMEISYLWWHLPTSPSAFPLSQISTFSILVPCPLTHPLLTSIGQYYGPHFCNLCKMTSCYPATLHLARFWPIMDYHCTFLLLL